MTSSYIGFAFREEYERVRILGDKLAGIDSLINWEAFRPIVKEIYDNKTGKGGRLIIDEIIMVKILVLQKWHDLSDPELERQITDRISFRKFLNFPDTIPDYSTVCSFRERLSKTSVCKKIWQELQRQLDAKGLKIKKGVIQDATIITSDTGYDRSLSFIEYSGNTIRTPSEAFLEAFKKKITSKVNHVA